MNRKRDDPKTETKPSKRERVTKRLHEWTKRDVAKSRTSKDEESREISVGNCQVMQEKIQLNEETIDALRAEIEKADERLRFAELGVITQDLPTEAEIIAKRRQFNFIEGRKHIAVVGAAGCGKTKFLESISDEVDSQHPRRYISENILWYELPGVGVDGRSRINYFHEYGVYAFDLIIILTGNRVIDFDLAIASRADKGHLPYIFVRSKSDELIQSIRDDVKEQNEQLDGEKLEEKVSEELNLKIIEIQHNLNDNLIRTKLPPLSTGDVVGTRFFLVNCRTLKPTKRRQVEAEIDEDRLRRFITKFASSPQAKRSIKDGSAPGQVT